MPIAYLLYFTVDIEKPSNQPYIMVDIFISDLKSKTLATEEI